ncbi:MAG: Arm DNA-binding domain-containing protein [Cytophagales bacterium]|nr:Arm DNA-binding domain-containing protein [Cytophagales bacterium]
MSSVTISPFARETKDGKVTVYIRIIIAGEKIDRSTGIKIDKSKWDTKNTKVKGSGRLAVEYNNSIETKVSHYHKIAQDITRDEMIPTKEEIKRREQLLKTKAQSNSELEVKKPLTDVFKHLYGLDDLSDIKTNNTKKKRQSEMVKLEKYLSSESGKEYKNASVEDWRNNVRILEEFAQFLHTEIGNGQSTIAKSCQIVKSVIRQAIERHQEGYLSAKVPTQERKDKENIYWLFDHELETLYMHDFQLKSRQNAVNMFLIMSSTAMRIGDYREFAKEPQKYLNDTEVLWNAGKTKNNHMIQRNMLYFEKVYQRLNGQLPSMAGANMNSYLKLALEEARVDRKVINKEGEVVPIHSLVHSHMAKSTTIMYMLVNLELDLETVSILTSTDVQTIKNHYSAYGKIEANEKLRRAIIEKNEIEMKVSKKIHSA